MKPFGLKLSNANDHLPYSHKKQLSIQIEDDLEYANDEETKRNNQQGITGKASLD